MSGPRQRASDIGGLTYDSPKPRLVTLKQKRKEKALFEELTGETKKREMSKVSLPKFSWDKENG
jgi:hypothetical protein